MLLTTLETLQGCEESGLVWVLTMPQILYRHSWFTLKRACHKNQQIPYDIIEMWPRFDSYIFISQCSHIWQFLHTELFDQIMSSVSSRTQPCSNSKFLHQVPPPTLSCDSTPATHRHTAEFELWWHIGEENKSTILRQGQIYIHKYSKYICASILFLHSKYSPFGRCLNKPRNTCQISMT